MEKRQEGQKKRCAQDGVLVRNNARKPAGGIRDKRPTPEITNKELLLATRNERQPERTDKRRLKTANKGLSLATGDKKSTKTADKGPSLVTRDKR